MTIAAGFENVDASLLRDLFIIAAATVGLALGVKKLFWASPGISQPLSITIEREVGEKFVSRPEFNKFETYVHKSNHGFAEQLHQMLNSADDRSARLAALEADSKTHTRQNSAIEGKIDRIISDVGVLKGRTTEK